MPETFRVIKPHQPSDADALTARKEERLSFERRETEWARWVWCTSHSGKRAWVPENWVQIEGDCCVMKRDYDATELAVEVGEVLTVRVRGKRLDLGHDGERRERLGSIGLPSKGVAGYAVRAGG